jgi:methionyl aminopeptidase
MDQQEVESYKKAGIVAREIREFMRGYIKPGMKLYDIAAKVDEMIRERGAEPAFPLGLSVDKIAAHFTPTSNDEDVAEGLLKFDIGVCINGYIADTAMTLDLTEDSRHKSLVELNEKVMEDLIENIKPEIKISKIGDVVEATVEEYNEKSDKKVSIIRGLSGHQVAQNTIHAGLTISNYKNSSNAIFSDMAIAIEPFLTAGNGEIHEGKGGGIYTVKSEEKPRDKDAREVLEYIKENYKTRPFCRRWLEVAGFEKLRFIFSSLERQGIIYQYPLLIEKSGKAVSQIENTFVAQGGEVFVTTLGS